MDKVALGGGNLISFVSVGRRPQSRIKIARRLCEPNETALDGSERPGGRFGTPPRFEYYSLALP
uniref:Uncharacterized protein n=1 Tax=Plectus sambesii TaxID=2011161 RepID=A0A914UPY6_9BILA